MLQPSLLTLLVAPAAAHNMLITPKPRNAIDSELPEWSGGKAPYVWQPHGDFPCACTNGTSSVAWQDFRDGFRPGIGREEWTRAYG